MRVSGWAGIILPAGTDQRLQLRALRRGVGVYYVKEGTSQARRGARVKVVKRKRPQVRIDVRNAPVREEGMKSAEVGRREILLRNLRVADKVPPVISGQVQRAYVVARVDYPRTVNRVVLALVAWRAARRTLRQSTCLRTHHVRSVDPVCGSDVVHCPARDGRHAAPHWPAGGAPRPGSHRATYRRSCAWFFLAAGGQDQDELVNVVFRVDRVTRRRE